MPDPRARRRLWALIITTAVVWIMVLVVCIVAWSVTRQPPLTPINLGGG